MFINLSVSFDILIVCFVEPFLFLNFWILGLNPNFCINKKTSLDKAGV